MTPHTLSLTTKSLGIESTKRELKGLRFTAIEKFDKKGKTPLRQLSLRSIFVCMEGLQLLLLF